MKICYLGSELDTHFSSLNLVLEELKRRGHEIVIQRWHFNNQIAEKQNVDIEADIYLTEMGVPQNIRPKDSYWIEFRHGLSPYKMNSGTHKGLYARLIPTIGWKDAFDKASKNTVLTVPTNGWCKMDLYFTRLQKITNLKKRIYKEYNFDPSKQLITYAPTGIRFGAIEKKGWIDQHHTINGYRRHGSYYHRDIVREISLKYANFYEIPHPCVDRTLDAMQRLDLLVVSDLLVSDISSIALEYTAMDKPIILLKKNIEDYNPTDFRYFGLPENSIIDLGDIIAIEEFSKTLPYRLEHDDYKKVRNIWKEKLLGSVDGHCAEREADAIIKICKSLGILK